MKRPSYKEAIEWVILNDCPENEGQTGHICSCLVADIFSVPIEKVMKDIFKQIDSRTPDKQRENW